MQLSCPLKANCKWLTCGGLVEDDEAKVVVAVHKNVVVEGFDGEVG